MTVLTDERLDRLVDAAASARGRAYAPYSDFPMGAAVLGLEPAGGTTAPDGPNTDRSRASEEIVITGFLIENVSLGLAMCAERVALFSALTAGVKPEAIALCSERTEDELTFPCGACLQVGLELAGPELAVVATDPDGVRAQEELGSLLNRAPKRHTPEYR